MTASHPIPATAANRASPLLKTHSGDRHCCRSPCRRAARCAHPGRNALRRFRRLAPHAPGKATRAAWWKLWEKEAGQDGPHPIPSRSRVAPRTVNGVGRAAFRSLLPASCRNGSNAARNDRTLPSAEAIAGLPAASFRSGGIGFARGEVTDLAPPRLRRPASGTSRQGNAPDAFGLPPDLRPTPSPLARRGCG